MKKPAAILSTLAALLATYPIFFYGGQVDLSTQRELLDSLQTVSSIVFAIFGAWMAIVYPLAMKEIGSTTKSVRLEAIEKVRHLLVPLILSSFALFSSIAMEFLGPLLRQFVFLHAHRTTLLGVHYNLLTAILVFQIGVLVFFFKPIVADYMSMLRSHHSMTNKEKLRPLKRPAPNRPE